MLRLMIADDEATIRHGLEQLVLSYELDIQVVATAEDGLEAIQKVEEFQPELIIMDINMPHLNGLEAIREIRKKQPHAVIIIISGYDEFSYAQQALEMGVFRYLLKPIDFRGFKEVLQQAVDQCLEQICQTNANPPLERAGESSQQLALVAIEYIQEHYRDSDLTLGDVAKKHHMSASYLARMMKEKTGYNFSEYVGHLRLSIAKRLLCEYPERSVNEIAEQTGFNSQHYFSRAFKNYTNYSPLQYRKMKLEERQ